MNSSYPEPVTRTAHTIIGDEVEAILLGFSEHLRDHCEVITQQWTAQVSQDERIPQSRKLTQDEVRCEMPELLMYLAEMVCAPFPDQGSRSGLESMARNYGRQRQEQGYRSAEVLQELMRLRGVALGQSFAFEELTPAFRGTVRRVAVQRLHSLFDIFVGEAVEQFLDEPNAKSETHPKGSSRRSVTDALPPDLDSLRLRLLRNAAHELRNLINSAQLGVQGLAQVDDEESRAHFLRMIGRNHRQMNEILGDLVDLSVLESGKPKLRIGTISVSDFAGELLLTFRSAAVVKGLSFAGHCEPSLVTFSTDATKLKQIAVNLLSNAVKYTDKGGISFRIQGVDELSWKFSVEDTGVGFDSNVSERLFDEFYRAQSTADREGIGLGLPIVKKLVATLGGTMNVRSQPGLGSCFEVFLPREYPPC